MAARTDGEHADEEGNGLGRVVTNEGIHLAPEEPPRGRILPARAETASFARNGAEIRLIFASVPVGLRCSGPKAGTS
ncbi:hypothetical protein AKJ09_10256 [Labilithrix luteola]|uniref:Uncharacterized protein n=1 Tax=Labilithrix luteola TaxID=1391654 RepID=A0A0K1QCZ0_9BACT|nr:hypothetical protein AKJ09_10256 [Labilithrix luteola]